MHRGCILYLLDTNMSLNRSAVGFKPRFEDFFLKKFGSLLGIIIEMVVGIITLNEWFPLPYNQG